MNLEKYTEQYLEDTLVQLDMGLLTFPVVVNGARTDALLDCGASREFIDSTWAKNQGFHCQDLQDSFPVKLADGTSILCSQYIRNVAIKFKQFTHKTDVYVLDFKGEHTLVLGQTFLVRRNPDIDWRERTLTLRKGKPKTTTIVWEVSTLFSKP